MKLAMSNIGWAVHDDLDVLEALRAHGVAGIEVAPTKVWPGWEGATVAAAEAYRERLGDQGFALPALQAILFGKPALSLFARDARDRSALRDHIAHVADLAAALGAQVLVFGAPRARLRGALPVAEAMAHAAETFRALAAVCEARATCLCIEPVPGSYGCDFVTDAGEALTLVERVDHPGFGLHLDAGSLYTADEELTDVLQRGRARLRHYHISEPELAGFASARAPHVAWLRALRAADYRGWVSIEVDATKHVLSHTLAFARDALRHAGEAP